MKEPKDEYELIQQLSILADNLKAIPLCDGYELTVKVAVKLIEKLTTDAWQDAMRDPPKITGTYLCTVVFPDDRGGYKETQRVLWWDGDHWSCEGMIVTHWREKPMGPTWGGFRHG